MEPQTQPAVGVRALETLVVLRTLPCLLRCNLNLHSPGDARRGCSSTSASKFCLVTVIHLTLITVYHSNEQDSAA